MIERGKMWVIVMREYHVECATEACEAEALTEGLNCNTKRQAEKMIREEQGFVRRGGFWYCGDCASAIVKRCRVCRQTKPLSAFYHARRMKNGRDNRCIKCTARIAKERYAKREAGGALDD